MTCSCHDMLRDTLEIAATDSPSMQISRMIFPIGTTTNLLKTHGRLLTILDRPADYSVLGSPISLAGDRWLGAPCCALFFITGEACAEYCSPDESNTQTHPISTAPISAEFSNNSCIGLRWHAGCISVDFAARKMVEQGAPTRMSDNATANQAILFVEDDDTGRELGCFNLQKAGYEVDAASNGEETLERFFPERHGVVITDLRLPRVSGMEVLKQVKQRSPDTPVIVITAYGNVDLAVETMKVGAYDFIVKPFNRDHLILTIHEAPSP